MIFVPELLFAQVQKLNDQKTLEDAPGSLLLISTKAPVPNSRLC